jgi:hypothetical protein
VAKVKAADDDFALRRAQVKRLVARISTELEGRLDVSIDILARKLDDDEIDDFFEDFGGAIDRMITDAETEAENAESAKENAEIELREVLSSDSCPFCGTALLVGESLHDCRKCRADKAADADFHARNPGVRATARDPLAGIL